MPQAGLKLLARHASQFNKYLVEDYEVSVINILGPVVYVLNLSDDQMCCRHTAYHSNLIMKIVRFVKIATLALFNFEALSGHGGQGGLA